MFIPAVSHLQQKPVIFYLFPNTAVILLYSFMPKTIEHFFPVQKGARCFIHQHYCVPKQEPYPNAFPSGK